MLNHFFKLFILLSTNLFCQNILPENSNHSTHYLDKNYNSSYSLLFGEHIPCRFGSNDLLIKHNIFDPQLQNICLVEKKSIKIPKIEGIIVLNNYKIREVILEKCIVIGVYGAGGKNAGPNPDLRTIVESFGGKMFMNSWGINDKKILKCAIEAHKKNKNIIFYGYSRGASNIVRIANILGQLNIEIAEINLFDPVSFSGDFVFKYDNVKKINNFFQRNPTDLYKLFFSKNPFIGLNIVTNSKKTILNNINLTGIYYQPQELVSHLNIISKVYDL